MARRRSAIGQRSISRIQQRLQRRTLWWWRALVRRYPVLRLIGVWGAALLLNGALGAALLYMAVIREPRGIPDAPPAVSIFVVPAIVVAADAAVPINAPVLEAVPEEVPEPVPEEVATLDNPQAEEAITEPVVSPAAVSSIALPQISLPTVDVQAGQRNGLTALDCYAYFADKEKAAECAGRIVRSGWQAEVAEIGGDWAKIAEDMRRGGAAVPRFGPDRLSDLGENEFIYQPTDERFQSREFDGKKRKHQAAFGSAKELREFKRLEDARRYIGDGDAVVGGYGIGESTPITGWRPSWQLRDDPNIDQSDIDRIVIKD